MTTLCKHNAPADNCMECAAQALGFDPLEEQPSPPLKGHPLPPSDPAKSTGGKPMKKHDLKCWPDMFAAIRASTKTFELRKNDRDYQVGDVLNLQEFEPCQSCEGEGVTGIPCGYDPCPACEGKKGRYTGQSEERIVTFVLSGWGLKDGYVALGLASTIPQRLF